MDVPCPTSDAQGIIRNARAHCPGDMRAMIGIAESAAFGTHIARIVGVTIATVPVISGQRISYHVPARHDIGGSSDIGMGHFQTRVDDGNNHVR